MSIVKAAFLISVLAIMWSFYRLHRNPDVVFNLLDLLMENGRVSKVSFLVMGAFFVTSWVMLALQASGKMTEVIFAAYGSIWVAPLITRLMNPPQDTKTVSTASVTTTTKAKK